MRLFFSRSLLAGAPLVLALASGCTDEPESDELPPAGLAGGAKSDEAAPEGFAALPPEEKLLTVGELSLTRADHVRAMVHQAARLGLPPGELPPEVAEVLEAPAYEQLLKRGLLFEEAKRRKLLVSDEQVEEEKGRLISRLQEGRTLDDVLKAMRSTEEEFLRDLRIDLSIGRLMQELYAELPVFDEAKAKELFEKDKSRWANADQASASHILVAVSPDAPPDAVAKANERAEALRAKVTGKDKKAFAAVAKADSDDPSAKTSGGELGWFTRREMLPGFAEAAFGLKEGEVSPLVRTDKGFHILFGQGVRKQSASFDDVKERIIGTERVAARTEMEQNLLAELAEKTKVVRHHEPRPAPGAAEPPAAGMPGMPGMPGAPGAAAAGGMPMPPAGAGGAGHGGAAGGGGGGGAGHPGMPLPSRDNVLPGAANPHGGSDLKLKPSSADDDMQLKLKLPAQPAE